MLLLKYNVRFARARACVYVVSGGLAFVSGGVCEAVYVCVCVGMSEIWCVRGYESVRVCLCLCVVSRLSID